MISLCTVNKNKSVPWKQLTAFGEANIFFNSITVVENVNALEWLKGGEILLLSDRNLLDYRHEFKQLFDYLKNQHCCGLGIKMLNGTQLSQHIVDIARQVELPIFIISSKVTYLDIMTPINEAIVYQQGIKFFRDSALKFLLEAKNGYDVTPEYINEFIPDASFVTCISIEFKYDSRMTFECIRHNYIATVHNIYRYFSAVKLQHHILEYYILDNLRDITVLLFHNTVSMKISSLPKQLTNLVKYAQIGISTSDSISHIYNVNQQAKTALNIGKTCLPNQSVYLYKEIEFFDLLQTVLTSARTRASFSFMDPLLNDKGLLDTLFVFFRCNENIHDTSAALFVHTNTLRYRLSKIQLLTGLDYKNSFDKIKLFLGLIFIKTKQPK